MQPRQQYLFYQSILLVLLVLAVTSQGYAQQASGTAVDIFGNTVDYSTLTGLGAFEGDQDLENYMVGSLDKVLSELPFKPEIPITAATGRKLNVMIVLDDFGDPLIIYKEEFVEEILAESNGEWMLLSILAHEIGHYVENHLVKLFVRRNALSKQELRSLELEADEISGRIMFRLRSDLEQAQAAVLTFSDADGRGSHPDKDSRAFNIGAGWYAERSIAPDRSPDDPVPDVQTTALVSISSVPSGATVYLDGGYFGVTPLAQTELLTGTHKVRLSSPNYEVFETNFEVIGGQNATLNYSLIAAPSPIVTPPVIRQNSDWVENKRTINGVAMVEVPAGSYTMGSTQAEIDSAFRLCEAADSVGGRCQEAWFTSQGPQSEQRVANFWLDETEVTRSAYESCVRAGVCSGVEASDFSTTNNQPINKVDWKQAATYCEWQGARLPTEAEWEYAARGPDRLLYPWGNGLRGNEANHSDASGKQKYPNWTWPTISHDDGYADTAPVGSYPQDRSWVGARDMAGNVAEWTSTESKAYPYDAKDGREIENYNSLIQNSIVIRGGSFFGPASYLRAADRDAYEPDVAPSGIGFRCARSNSGF